MRFTLKLLMTTVFLLLIGSTVAVLLYARYERQKMEVRIDELLSKADADSYALDFDNHFSRFHPLPVTTAPSQPSGSGGIYGGGSHPDLSPPEAVAEIRSLGPAAVPHLIEVLGRRNTIKCLLALEALAEMNDRRAVPKICELLDDEQEIVRIYAAYALGKIKDPAAVEALMKVPDREAEAESEQASAASTARFYSSDTQPSESSKADPSVPRLAIVAAWALGEIGDKRAVGALVTMLTEWDGPLGEIAGDGLVKIGDKSAIEQIKAACTYPDGKLRLRPVVAKTVLRLGAALEIEDILSDAGELRIVEGKPVVGGTADRFRLLCDCILLWSKTPTLGQSEANSQALVRAWPLDKESFWVRRPVIDTDSTWFRESLVKAMSKVPLKTWDIIYGLRMTEVTIVPGIFDASSKPVVTKVANQTVLQLIKECGGPDSEEILLKWMGDEDSDFRVMTLRFMGRHGFHRAIRPFLQDKDQKVREAAFDALCFAGPAFPEMLRLLRSKDQPSAQKWDEYSAGLLAHPNFHVRFLASWMRGTLDNAEERLKDCLTDEEPCVREMAAEALKQFGIPASAP